jgi:hypothetical protein
MSRKLVLEAEDVEANICVVNIDQADLSVATTSVVAAVAALSAASAARGDELKLLIRQFDGVSKFGHLLHGESPVDVSGERLI